MVVATYVHHVALHVLGAFVYSSSKYRLLREAEGIEQGSLLVDRLARTSQSRDHQAMTCMATSDALPNNK